jgi:tetratricopeptide (TPR) repeat protein
VTPAGNRFLNADLMVGLAALCIAGAAWYSVTRPQGYFPPPGQQPVPEVAKPAADKAAQEEKPKHVYDPSLSADENRAMTLFEEAREEEQAGNRKAAAQHYIEAGTIDHKRKFYWTSLGSLSLAEMNFEQAYEAFNKAYECDCYDIDNLKSLGYTAQSMRKDAEARRFYLMALALQPLDQPAWEEIYSLSHVSDWDMYSEAIHQAVLTPADTENNNLIYRLNDEALRLNPDDYYLLVNRAFLNLRFMRLDRVPKDIDRALQLNSRGPAALLARAQLYNLTGQQDKAEQAYRACLAVSPQPVAYAEIGSIEMQKGELDAALHDYVMATQLGNDKPSWVTTMGKLQEMKTLRDAEAKKQQAKKQEGKSQG